MSKNVGIKGMENFLLHYPSFDNQREYLLAGISVAVRPCSHINILSNYELVNLQLYGS